MPPTGLAVQVIGNTAFHPFSTPNDALGTEALNSSIATESVSSDNMQASPRSPFHSPKRMPPGSPQQRSPDVSYTNGSPQQSPSVNTNSPMAQGSPSDRGLVHPRTNFGKTRGYVPPMIPSTSPGSRTGMVDTAPAVPPSPRGNVRMIPFEDEEDAPDDEAQFRTVRSLRPKPDSAVHRNGRLHRRDNSATQDATLPPPRPEAYISETDESSLGLHDLRYEPRTVAPPSPLLSQDTRQPSPEEEPFDVAPARSDAKEARHPSPLENIQASPIRPTRKQQEPAASPSPRRRRAEELGDIRRRRRARSKKASQPPALEYQQQQFEMPSPAPVDPSSPPMRVTSTKTSDLTDDMELDPIPSFDAPGKSVVKRAIDSEMEYHEEGDGALPPPPPESPGYEEFVKGREASESPRKDAVKPKSILRSKRTASQASDHEEDDDSLFDFGGGDEKSTVLGKGATIRKSSLKSGATMNSNTRRGRRARRRSEEPGHDDDESLIQYGEVPRQRSSSLQERTQEAWTFRSKRSFSVSASSPKKEGTGVQFENTNTVHHFDDQTIGTNGTGNSLNSLYTKSPESEAEDLIKDLLLIGSGEHSNPGRRKLKYQPEYKRQLKERADDSTIDDNTLGTTDISLNTLDYTTSRMAYKKEESSRNGVKDGASLDASKQTDGDALSQSACDTLDNKSTTNEGGDPLSIVWSYVEIGMQAIGLAEVATESSRAKEKTESKAMKLAEQPAEERVTNDTACDEDSDADSDAVVEAKSSELGSSDTTTAEESFVDEVKEDNKGSFGEVMEYIFGDTAQREKQQSKEKRSLASSTVSVATSSTPLEDDPRLEQLALHAVKSKHQVYDMEYNESFPFDLEKDIKFSIVKTKLPLGVLFHENDGGCWITKVFPDGNAAKEGGLEVGDQLAAINGISAIKLRVDQICTLITEAPDPNDIELTLLRYVGQLRPLVTEADEPHEIYEVTNEETVPKPKKRSLRPKLKPRDPSPRPKKSPKPKAESQQKPSKGEAKPRKGLGKWFGKGRRKSQEF